MLFDKASALLLASSGLQPSRHVISRLQTPDLAAEFDWKNVSTITNEIAMPRPDVEQITAHESLVYHDCYDGFQCARLQVPMDWTAAEGADDRTVQIALIKLPAPVPVTDSRYGGAVVFNPGETCHTTAKPTTRSLTSSIRWSRRFWCTNGTYQSLPRKMVGADHGQVRLSGVHYQTQISARPDTDNQTAKFFDVIGFDPRGVSNTSPTFRCFPNFIEQWNYMRELSAYGLPGSSDTAFTNLWTSTRTLADSCSRRAIQAGIGEHMSTTSVARDIVEIFERHGEWREQEARKLLSSSGQSERDLPNHVRYQSGQEMVQYWGFSYGTVLGATLADLYPDRVQRMILDGVVDSFDYYKGTRTTDLQDTDLELAKFAEYCWRGGPENCALYNEDGPNSIAQRFTNVTQNLVHNPIGVPGTDNYSSDLVTYSDLKQILTSVSYDPLGSFDYLATIMADLENGNATRLVEGRRSASSELLAGLPKECLTDGPYSDACFPSHVGLEESMILSAIECSDAEPQTNMTKEQYWNYVQDMIKQSKMVGDVWATTRLACTQVNSDTRPPEVKLRSY